MTSGAIERENASSAAFEATYAENRGVFVCSPIVEMLMMCPDPRSRITGSRSRISLTGAK